MKMYQVSLLYTTSLTAYVASLTAQWKQFLSTANLLTSVREISKTSRMFLPHYLLDPPLSLFPSTFPFKMIFPKPLLLFKWAKYFSFLRNRTHEAAINIFNFLIFINLTFCMLLNIHFQQYRYRFENFTFQRYLVLDIPSNPDRVTLTKKVIFWGKNQCQSRFFEGNFPSTSRLGLIFGGRFNRGFFAPPVWGAHIWRGLFSEFYIFFLEKLVFSHSYAN